MRIVHAVLVLAGLTLAAGCATGGLRSAAPPSSTVPPDLSAVLGDRTVSVPGDIGLRQVLVHHPDSAGSRAPLVVVLHGEGGSAEQARDELGWNAVADREGFVVAYPEGFNHVWNAGPTCCFPNNSGVNDIGFLNQALSTLTRQDFIDRSRVYVVGFSVGGSMAYAWECAHPGLLAGIGPVDASLLIRCSVLSPVSVAAVYGEADRVVRTGGQQDPRPGDTDQALALFRGVDGCPSDPAIVIAGPPATERSWNCVATHSVSTAIIDGVGHQWPGIAPMTIPSSGAVAPDASVSRTDQEPSSTAFNTDEWLWSHLKNAHSH